MKKQTKIKKEDVPVNSTEKIFQTWLSEAQQRGDTKCEKRLKKVIDKHRKNLAVILNKSPEQLEKYIKRKRKIAKIVCKISRALIYITAPLAIILALIYKFADIPTYFSNVILGLAGAMFMEGFSYLGAVSTNKKVNSLSEIVLTDEELYKKYHPLDAKEVEDRETLQNQEKTSTITPLQEINESDVSIIKQKTKLNTTNKKELDEEDTKSSENQLN